jgi:hypothetical protein
MMTIDILHHIDRVFADDTIEVYGEPDMGWYEWRILSRGEIVEDSGNAGYRSPTLALRDALNWDAPPAGSAKRR